MGDKPTYHFVSQVHWDREWVTSLEESRALLVDFMDDLFTVLETDPAFRSFTLDGEMTVVTDYLETRPDQRERFERHTREGRILLGPWYVLADEFLPSGEAHIRNLLAGIELASRFGEPMRFGYIPDQFGHIAQMPQILRGFGIQNALIYRGFGGEAGQEGSEYRWRAPDGSVVLAFHLPRDGYSFAYFARDTEEESDERFERARAEIDTRARSRHRLVMNGGDHHWPDTRLSAVLQRLARQHAAEFLHSSLPAYAAAVRKDVLPEELPVLDGETRFGFRHAFAVVGGTASARIHVKQENYQCQVLLESLLEPLNAMAVASGFRSRADLIRRAWRYCLENQVHDVMCGTSVDRVFADARNRFKRCRELASQTMALLLEDLVPRDPRRHGDDEAVVIVNTLPFPRSALVECAIDLHLQDLVVGINPDQRTGPVSDRAAGLRILDEDGREIAHQFLDRHDDYGLVGARDAYPRQLRVDRFTVLLDVHAAIPTGMRIFRVERSAAPTEFPSRAAAGSGLLENDFVRVEVDNNGRITVHDKIGGVVLRDFHEIVDEGDSGDCYSYCFPEKDERISEYDFPCEIRIIERGPLRAAIEIGYVLRIPVEAADGGSARSGKRIDLPVRTRIALAYNSPLVEFTVTVDNTARDHRLRTVFHTGIDTVLSSAGAQFATIEREHREHDWALFDIEKPLNLEVLQRFVLLKDAARAFAVLTKGLPEYELAADGSGELAITLLRCVGELSKSGLATRPGGDAGWKNDTPDAQCPGRHRFEYAVLVSSPAIVEAGILEEAEAYHVPFAVAVRKHRVSVDTTRLLARLSAPGIVWSALKETEAGDGIIARFYNPHDTPRRFQLETGMRAPAVIPVRLDETPDGEAFTAGTIEGELPPYRIATYKLLLPS